MNFRPSQRKVNELREVQIIRNFTRYAEGSVLVQFGNTQVLCTATVDNKVPSFLRNSGKGWITAEYGMLPRATHTRSSREAARGKQSGRTQEIQRLIGRSLRAIVDLEQLGERQIIVDCDVLQADGGTRTASITGACVAVHDALAKLVHQQVLECSPMKEWLAAISVGLYQGQAVLDLDYEEDSACDTDMNVVMTQSGKIIEVQATAEGAPFEQQQLLELLALAKEGITSLIFKQKQACQGA